MPNLKPLGLALLASILMAGAVQAHNFWIEPSTFTPAPGQRLAVRLRVGVEAKGDPVPRDPSLMKRFIAAGPAGDATVPGVPNTEPAGFEAFSVPGLYTIVYESGRSPIQLDATVFEQYLKDEGLETISARRARQGKSGDAAKEVFSRCAKALLNVGNGGAGPGFDRVFGERLELVAEKNPYTLAGGGELPVHLLYEGKPLAGALVMALQRDRPDKADKIMARTDARGRVTLKLDRPGFWLIKAVHMIPAPPDAGADWESFWASLTFALPSR
jgi:uncharacterized GH25 family protein